MLNAQSLHNVPSVHGFQYSHACAERPHKGYARLLLLNICSLDRAKAESTAEVETLTSLKGFDGASFHQKKSKLTIVERPPRHQCNVYTSHSVVPFTVPFTLQSFHSGKHLAAILLFYLLINVPTFSDTSIRKKRKIK